MATVSEATARKPRRKLNPGFDRFSGLYLWALFIIVFGLWVPDQFLTAATLHSVAAQQAVVGIVALAILIPLAAGLYDLSVGATAGLVSVTTVVLMNDHHWARSRQSRSAWPSRSSSAAPTRSSSSGWA